MVEGWVDVAPSSSGRMQWSPRLRLKIEWMGFAKDLGLGRERKRSQG